MKIRVLHVLHGLSMGGTETMLMNVFRNVDKTKFEFSFLLHTNELGFYTKEVESLGGKIYVLPKFNGANVISYSKACDSFFKKNRFDIVHGHISSSASIYLHYANKYGITTIAHSHNIYSNSVKDVIHRAYTFSNRYIANYFFAPSLEAGKDRYGKKIVNSKKFYLVTNGVLTNKYRFSSNSRFLKRKELSLSDHTKVIINIGRFVKQKNHKFILDVFDNYRKNHDDTKLILVGEGKLEQDIYQRIEDLNLTKNVIILKNRQDIPELLMASDIFFFPSLNEGLGIALIEAQLTGITCVISDKIPTSAIINRQLVSVQSLETNKICWAKNIENGFKNISQNQRATSFNDFGYDISQTTKKLEIIYKKIYSQRLQREDDNRQ
ncbi:glycosyltransferase [Enterococcus casseliflavus]|uniref:glycosyltransferase n=1 Tax=Enterococcus casseliflavus TaxID=37734 RepID=UPI0035D7881D